MQALKLSATRKQPPPSNDVKHTPNSSSQGAALPPAPPRVIEEIELASPFAAQSPSQAKNDDDAKRVVALDRSNTDKAAASRVEVKAKQEEHSEVIAVSEPIAEKQTPQTACTLPQTRQNIKTAAESSPWEPDDGTNLFPFQSPPTDPAKRLEDRNRLVSLLKSRTMPKIHSHIKEERVSDTLPVAPRGEKIEGPTLIASQSADTKSNDAEKAKDTGSVSPSIIAAPTPQTSRTGENHSTSTPPTQFVGAPNTARAPDSNHTETPQQDERATGQDTTTGAVISPPTTPSMEANGNMADDTDVIVHEAQPNAQAEAGNSEKETIHDHHSEKLTSAATDPNSTLEGLAPKSNGHAAKHSDSESSSGISSETTPANIGHTDATEENEIKIQAIDEKSGAEPDPHIQALFEKAVKARKLYDKAEAAFRPMLTMPERDVQRSEKEERLTRAKFFYDLTYDALAKAGASVVSVEMQKQLLSVTNGTNPEDV